MAYLVSILDRTSKVKCFLLAALFATGAHASYAQGDTARLETAKKIPAKAHLVGRWFLIPALESDTATGRIAEISLDTKLLKFIGNTGCNRMTGTFEVSDSTIHFSEKMATTRMFCSGYNESAFLQNLLRVDGYKFRKGMLVFTVGSVEVFRWRKKVVPVKKTGKA